jgi:hypothetical protein
MIYIFYIIGMVNYKILCGVKAYKIIPLDDCYQQVWQVNIYNKCIPKFMVWQVKVNLKSFAF